MAWASNAPQKSHSFLVVGLYMIGLFLGKYSIPQGGEQGITNLEGEA
jgi:hypothetical protein